MPEEFGPSYEGKGLLSRENVEKPLNNKPEESTLRNTFLGQGAAVAVGSKTEGCVAVGEGALAIAKQAVRHTAVGVNALALATQSEAEITADNTAIGFEALGAVTINANGNTAIGSKALGALKTESNNTAVGLGALEKTTAGGNTAVGEGAGAANTTGSKNTAIGSNASAGGGSGKENVSLGFEAGASKKGSANIFIGYKAGAGAATVSNKLVIGNNSTKAIIEGVMSATEASQEIGFLGAAAVKRPKVTGNRTTEFAEVLKTLCKGLAELGLITDETT